LKEEVHELNEIEKPSVLDHASEFPLLDVEGSRNYPKQQQINSNDRDSKVKHRQVKSIETNSSELHQICDTMLIDSNNIVPTTCSTVEAVREEDRYGIVHKNSSMVAHSPKRFYGDSPPYIPLYEAPDKMIDNVFNCQKEYQERYANEKIIHYQDNEAEVESNFILVRFREK